MRRALVQMGHSGRSMRRGTGLILKGDSPFDWSYDFCLLGARELELEFAPRDFTILLDRSGSRQPYFGPKFRRRRRNEGTSKKRLGIPCGNGGFQEPAGLRRSGGRRLDADRGSSA